MVLLVVVAAGIVNGVSALARHNGPVDQPASDQPAYGSKAYCLKAAPEMVRRHPELTPTNQSAYDGCRDAGQFVDEVGGKVNP